MTNSSNYRRHNFDVSFFLSQSGNHKLKNVDRLEMAGIVFTTYIGVFFFYCGGVGYTKIINLMCAVIVISCHCKIIHLSVNNDSMSDDHINDCVGPKIPHCKHILSFFFSI